MGRDVLHLVDLVHGVQKTGLKRFELETGEGWEAGGWGGGDGAELWRTVSGVLSWDDGVEVEGSVAVVPSHSRRILGTYLVGHLLHGALLPFFDEVVEVVFAEHLARAEG